MSEINFFLVFLAANDAGETPLDLAQRLRHTKCEELVGIFFIFNVSRNPEVLIFALFFS